MKDDDRERLLMASELIKRMLFEHPQKFEHFSDEFCCLVANIAVGERHRVDGDSIHQESFRLFMVTNYPHTRSLFTV